MSGKRSPSPAEDDLISPGKLPDKSGPGVEKRSSPKELKDAGEAIKKIKCDPKEFFKYANRTKKAKSRIGPLQSGNKYFSGRSTEIFSYFLTKILLRGGI